MKLKLIFEVEIDQAGLEKYYQEYPSFRDDDKETPGQTLAREAMACWDIEGLIAQADFGGWVEMQTGAQA